MSLSGCRVSLLLVGVILLSACGAVGGPTSEPGAVAPGVVTQVVPIPGVIEPENVRLQLDWTGGMAQPTVWGDLPELTLQDDGTLIYKDAQAMAVHLAEAQAQELVQQVLDLGFERLESYTDQCQTSADGTGLCIADATASSIRLRTPDGVLRQVVNYAEFANEPNALRAIRAFLTEYRNPEAQLYIPDKAVLYLRAIANPGDLEVLEWPLEPALLAKAPGEDNYCARVVGRREVQALAALPRQGAGSLYFRQGGRVWEVVLVPWLPGADYSAALAHYGQLCPEATPAASPLASTGWLLTLMEG